VKKESESKNENPVRHAKNSRSSRVCTNCGETTLVDDLQLGESVCSNCGLVIEENLVDLGKEYRIHDFKNDQQKERIGLIPKLTIYDKGLSTTFSSHTDANGKQLDYETQNTMRRLKRQNTRSKLNENKNKNLSISLTEIDRIASKLHLPNNVTENAAGLYRKALNKDLIKGRSIDSFAAASIYASCRLMGVPRSLKEVAGESKQSLKEVSYTYRLLHKELKLKPPVDDPFKYVPKVAAKINVNQPTEQLAIKILEKGDEEKVLAGKSPNSLAAAALYMACQETNQKRVQHDIAKAAGTTEVTLRKRIRDLTKIIHYMKIQPFDLLSIN
jgi:transcription initiation factor TFIIB